jgi:catechol 2,3-dioxygenase-like lactoylglutathione lyase family enzyme
VIVYVRDVEKALSFYERAFGLTRTFVDASASFGQLDTGSTALGFVTEARANSEFEGDFQRARLDSEPFNVELCLIFQTWRRRFAMRSRPGVRRWRGCPVARRTCKTAVPPPRPFRLGAFAAIPERSKEEPP